MGATAEAGFDFARLKRGLERSVPEDIVGLYAEDAEIVVVDRDRPPSAPLRLAGRRAIEGFWRDICGREMTHAVTREVVAPERAAFVEECVYPDGCHVTSAMTLDLDGGRIRRHLIVQAWDDASCVPPREQPAP